MNINKVFALKSTAIAIFLAQISAVQAEETPSTEVIQVTGSKSVNYLINSTGSANKLNLDISQTPQSVILISKEALDDFGLNNINQALEAVSPVNVERIETDRTYYTSRGFDINNLQIDGVGLPLSSGNKHGQPDTSIYESIAVVGGANGLMTGIGNPSATINFARKRPGTQSNLNLSISAGSWSATRAEMDGNLALTENTSARAVAVYDDSDSYLDRYSTNKRVIYAVVNHEFTPDTELTFGHSYVDSSAKGNNWGALPLYYSNGQPTNYDRSTNTSADWSNWIIIENNSFIELNHKLNNDWFVKAVYSEITTDEDSELFYVYGTPNQEDESGLKGYASEYDYNDKQKLADIYLSGQFDLFNRKHQIIAGVSHSTLSYEDVSLYDYTNGFPLIDSLPEWDGKTEVKPVFTDGATGSKIKQTQQSVYVNTRLELNKNWHAIAGGRLNKFEVAGESYGKDQTSDDSKFIPYLGTVYQFNDWLNAYASYTETYLPQTELDINDKRLDPVVGESKEIGFKAEFFGEKLLTNIAIFDIKQNNLAKLDPQTAELPADQQRSIGADGVTSQGVELSLIGQLSDQLNAHLFMTSYDMDGDELIENYTPKQVVKLALNYEFAQFPGLKTGLNMRWQDAISRKINDAITVEQDAYAVINWMAGYKFNDKVSLTFNAFNLTNEKYINTLYWAQSYYAAPANFSLRLDWTL